MKTKLLGVVAALALLGVSPAGAITYNLGSGGNFMVVGDFPETASIMLNITTTYVLPPFTAPDFTAVHGLIGLTTSLGGGFSVGIGNTPGQGCCTLPNPLAQIFTLERTFSIQASGGGAGFTIPSDQLFVTAQSASTIVPLVPTPLPAALPLFATGLGALGLLGWRRKRKQAA